MNEWVTDLKYLQYSTVDTFSNNVLFYSVGESCSWPGQESLTEFPPALLADLGSSTQKVDARKETPSSRL